MFESCLYHFNGLRLYDHIESSVETALSCPEIDAICQTGLSSLDILAVDFPSSLAL